VRRGSSVIIVSCYGLHDRAIEFRSLVEAKGFLPLVSVSRPVLEPIQPLVQWVPGAKARPGRHADHSPPSNAEVENE
jgi:hypothetical protein